MTEYEIKCPQTWAWYAGFVHDYNESDKKLYIRYPNDWKKPEWIDISSVRHKYTANPSWSPAENEEVECKARAEEHEPYGWWPCKAKNHTSSPPKRTSRRSTSSDPSTDLYSVQFLGWGETHNEILGRDFLRRKSRSALLSARNVTKKRYDVPSSLREWVSSRCDSQTILETLMPHKNIASQIIHISFAESTDKLVLIGGKRVLVTMQDIIYCFFEKQKSLLALEKRTEEMERRRDERKQAELAAQKTTFNIHPLLSGYLRGRKNLNIERVQAMRSVIRVEPGYSTCYVAAKTRKGMEEAVDALHIVCRKVVIPNEEMGQIIGYQGKQIQDIKGKSKVIKVISWKMWKEEFATLKRIQMSRSRDRGYGREMAEGAGKVISEVNTPRERGVVGFGMTADTMKACDMDNIFGADEVIDLTVGFESEFAPFSEDDRDAAKGDLERESAVKTDALVIIGRKSRVEICIFMLEMTLKHFRGIARARNDERKLRREISRLKGTSFNEYGRGGRMGGRGRRGGRGGMDRRRGGRGGGRDNRRYDRRDGGNNDRRRDGRDNDRRRNDRDRNRGDRDRQPRRERDPAADDQKDGSQQSNERRGDRGNNNSSNNNNRDGRDGRDGNGRDNRRRNDRRDGNDRNERGQGQRDGGGGGQRERYRKKEQQGQGGQGGGGQHDEKAETLGAPVRDVRVVEAEQAEQSEARQSRPKQGQGQDGAQTQGSSGTEQARRGKRRRGQGGKKKQQEAGGTTRGAAQQQQQQQPQQQPSEE